MTEEQSRKRERPALSIGSDNWPATVADKFVEFVELIKTNTTDRVVLAIRFAVYFLVASVALSAVVILMAVSAVRMADAYLPIGSGVGSATWAAHGFIGLIVSVIGFGAWASRSASYKPFYAALLIDAALVVAVIFYGVVRALA